MRLSSIVERPEISGARRGQNLFLEQYQVVVTENV
jgi:hypothetical protein